MVERARYYDVHNLGNMRHQLTIPAYEMDGARFIQYRAWCAN